MTRVLVLGAGGQLGRALARASLPAGWELQSATSGQIDLGDPRSISAGVSDARPDLVINAAAYTAVDRAESESTAAYSVNTFGVGRLAQAAWQRRAPLLHVSTDYVFDGAREGEWREDDRPGPISVYGASKLAGELLALAANPQTVVVRTSWVFSATGTNFVKTMLRLGKSRPELKIVDDQRGRPTSAADLAAGLVACAAAMLDGGSAPGVYHFSNSGPVTSWFGFAQEIFARSAAAGGPRPALQPIPTEQYPTPARRPRNSALDISRFRSSFGHQPPTWLDALDRVMGELAAHGEV